MARVMQAAFRMTGRAGWSYQRSSTRKILYKPMDVFLGLLCFMLYYPLLQVSLNENYLRIRVRFPYMFVAFAVPFNVPLAKSASISMKLLHPKTRRG